MAKTYAQMVETATRGAVNELATKEMNELVAEMNNAARLVGGKQKGKLVVTHEMTLEDGVLDMHTSVTTKRPPKAKPRTFLYPTKDGGLSEEDTRQGTLDFSTAKDVSTPGDKSVRDIRDSRSLAGNDRS